MSDIVNIRRRASSLEASPQFDSYSKVIIHVSDESTVTVGNDTGRTLEIDNPVGTQQMAADILARLKKKKKMLDKLKGMEKRFDEINEKLTDINIINDQEQYKNLMKELKNLTPIMDKYREYKAARDDYEEAKVKNSDRKMETKEFCHMVFKGAVGLYSFRLEVANSKSYESMAKYLDTLFGIQKTLGNSFKNAKRQMDAIKSFAGAVKAAADGTLDEAQAAETIGALDASVYGDRTQWIEKADAALAAYK